MYEAEFDGVGVVPLEKFENSALSGFTPRKFFFVSLYIHAYWDLDSAFIHTATRQ